MITLAKRGDLHARRRAMAVIQEKDVVHKLFEEAAELFGSVAGGYTRITKLGLRSGDAASMSLIELITPEAKPEKNKKKTEPKTEPKAKTEAVNVEKVDAAPEVKEEKADEVVEKVKANSEADEVKSDKEE